MCRADDEGGDYPEVYTQKEVKRARKEHRCEECGRSIAIGEPYRYCFVVFYGDASSAAICSHCTVATRWLMKNCGGWIFSEVTEEIREHARDYPALAMPLLRHVVAARRKWQRFDGSGLMRVPTMPPPISVQEVA